MVANKNAYEIRTEILSMAQGFVMQKFDDEKDKWNQAADRHPETGVVLSLKDAPQFPTSDDILKEANKLYSFVDG